MLERFYHDPRIGVLSRAEAKRRGGSSAASSVGWPGYEGISHGSCSNEPPLSPRMPALFSIDRDSSDLQALNCFRAWSKQFRGSRANGTAFRIDR